MIRVALIGYSLGGRFFHAPFIATTSGMQLAAIVTGNPDRQREALAEHPGVRIIASPEELFADLMGIDLVVISTPNRTHVPLALQAVEAKRAVVVDKPLAVTSADARILADTAKRHGVMATVFQNRRWDGDFLTLQRLLAEGALGRVHRFESRFERWRHALRENWRESPAPEEAGGLLFDLGSHLIDQALVLFGTVSDVYAEMDRRRAGSQVVDDVFLALSHVSGVRSHLWMSVMVAQNGPRLRVLGDRAAYVKSGMDVQEEALRRGEQPGGVNWGRDTPDAYGLLGVGEDASRVPTARGDYGAFYRHVVEAIRNGAPPPVDIADAIATLEIIERAMG
ncbi:MAG TPA: Gfo/Idh/MocA family oxidoreductase [Gemmatimonadaceae bacterium]|jgi:predicted dehydrogenase|nr:Gfo/Idh/MocA family oxidoreductase [Gemmatimonadaceae bacterium]